MIISTQDKKNNTTTIRQLTTVAVANNRKDITCIDIHALQKLLGGI